MKLMHSSLIPWPYPTPAVHKYQVGRQGWSNHMLCLVASGRQQTDTRLHLTHVFLNTYAYSSTGRRCTAVMQQQGTISMCFRVAQWTTHAQPVLNSKYAFICEMRLTMWVEIHVITCEYRFEQAVLILALQMLWCPNFGHTSTRKGLAQVSSSGTPPMCLYHLPPDITAHNHIS